MTLDEKVSLLGGQGVVHNGIVPGGHTGATVAVPRLGLPVVYLSDGPVGVRQGVATALPVPMALSATWDLGLARRAGRAVATEAKAKGNDIVLGPSVNILRTPQNGRTYESYGEETLQNARTGVAWVQGAQSTGVIADIKHYAGNNQEGQLGLPPFVSADGGRTNVSANMTQRTLREVYLPHFEAAVKQGKVGTLMCSYNKVNEVHVCENKFLLDTILRQQWGFRGMVISDYGASKGTATGLNAGLDFVPAQGLLDRSYSPTQIRAALTLGQVSESTLDKRVHAIIGTLFAFGFFDRSGFTDDDQQIPFAQHDVLARQIEERAITLLKNNGVLPLKGSTKRIAVVGTYADEFVTGGGSGGVEPRPGAVVTALDGIRDRAGRAVRVTFTDGSDPAESARQARAADVAIVVVGDVQSEGTDKTCVSMNCSNDALTSNSTLITSGSNCVERTCPINGTDNDRLVSQVAAAQPRTVVALQTGGPVLTPWRNKVAAVLEAWYPGQAGGSALARVLWGDVDPGGRLPATFPATADQLPTAGDRRRYPGVANSALYSEGLLVGYRWFDANKLRPAYPFGAGLSYTRFRYGNLTVTRGGPRGAVATAHVTIRNVGRRPGIAVPQLYVSKPSTRPLRQPVRQLAASHSVHIPAGRSVRVSLPLNDRSFASWDSSLRGEGGWRIPRGCHRLSIGMSSRTLTSSAVIARGAACPGARLRLPVTGLFDLPLAPPASSQRASS
ncbi:beta-glucosidase family protein [Nocardioides scoriae]|nr:glycoside hydrolase family 3 C-terminal domain-containing protein [Nocardioides scoriae]